jgi:hypothetical protein
MFVSTRPARRPAEILISDCLIQKLRTRNVADVIATMCTAPRFTTKVKTFAAGFGRIDKRSTYPEARKIVSSLPT